MRERCKHSTGTTTPISDAEYAWMKNQIGEVCEIWGDTVLHLEVHFEEAMRQVRPCLHPTAVQSSKTHERTTHACIAAKVHMATAIAGAKLARRVWGDAVFAQGIAFRVPALGGDPTQRDANTTRQL